VHQATVGMPQKLALNAIFTHIGNMNVGDIKYGTNINVGIVE